RCRWSRSGVSNRNGDEKGEIVRYSRYGLANAHTLVQQILNRGRVIRPGGNQECIRPLRGTLLRREQPIPNAPNEWRRATCRGPYQQLIPSLAVEVRR